MPTREEAWELLCEYTKGKSLRQHALAVEAAMRAAASRYGGAEEDADEWGITGMLHDFDYEMFPTADEHPYKGANILCGRGYSDRIIRAIMGHATYTGVPRDTHLARALFATDELCGFLVACAQLVGREQRSEEHTSELQSLAYLVCRLLLEQK